MAGSELAGLAENNSLIFIKKFLFLSNENAKNREISHIFGCVIILTVTGAQKIRRL